MTERSCFLGDGFPFARACGAALAEDAGDGVAADGEVELLFEAFGTEGGLLAELDALAFEAGGSLVEAVIGAAGKLVDGSRFAGLVVAEPFADGVTGNR